jgi:phenylacetate-CoA ligase
MMLKTITKFTPVKILQKFEDFLLADYSRTKKFITKSNPEVLEEISKKKALAIFKRTINDTPAYASFINRKRINPKKINSIDKFNQLIPATDKNNYIKKYSFEKRCREGHLPRLGNVDESGGTSGIATNWVHSFSEETHLFKAIQFEFNYVFEGDKKDFMVISAWSTGPWATGIKFCEAMERLSLVKNTATDPEDVVKTLKMFGNKRNYLISGYPPFVKNLIDNYDKKIKWKDYKIDLITGGEGVTLEWVHYIKNKLKKGAKVVSSYGASDIDIGVGFETPLCFFIRELIAKNQQLKQELFGHEDLPMVFQYNPTMHYINEVDAKDGKKEFEITVLDKYAISPKIKYNLHDEGRKFSFNELLTIIKKHEPKYLQKFSKKKEDIENILKLPFLCIFGRSDGTLSFDGANVFPDQIEDAILTDKELEKKTSRFKMERKHNKNHNVEFHVHVELKKQYKQTPKLKNKYVNKILTHLLEVNPDFKESVTKNKTLKPVVNLYHYDQKIFKRDDSKVKNIYILKSE